MSFPKLLKAKSVYETIEHSLLATTTIYIGLLLGTSYKCKK